MEIRREKRRKIIIMSPELSKNPNGVWGMKGHTFPKREKISHCTQYTLLHPVYNERTEDTKVDCHFI